MSAQGPADAFRQGAAAGDRLAPEIGFLVSHGIAVETLVEAERLARAMGVTADVALLRLGLLDDTIFYGALAREVGLPFWGEALDVHAMARFPETVLAGLVPLSAAERPGAPRFGYAPQGASIIRLLASRDQLVPGLALTTQRAIQSGVLLARAGSISARASDGLARSTPDLSFRDGLTARQVSVLCVAAGLVSGLMVQAPAASSIGASILLGLAFLAIAALRLAALLERIPTAPLREFPRMADQRLPAYTVLVALYREARIIPKLLTALSALDYPVFGRKRHKRTSRTSPSSSHIR